MAEQPAMDSATENAEIQTSVEEKKKVYASERDAVGDLKNLLGLGEPEPDSSKTQETESKVSENNEINSQENTDELSEDAELVDLMDEDEPSENTQELIDLDGEKLTLEEIKKERLRQKDYTQKTQKLAEERKEIESLKSQLSKENEEAKARRDEYERNLQILTQQLQQNQETVDWDALYQNDPAEFVKKKAEFDQRKELEQRAYQEQQRILAEKQKEQENIYNNYLEQERVKLVEKLPIYGDKEKGESFRKNLVNFAKEIGYTDSEVATLVDHRAVLVLADAYRYNKLRQANLNKKKVTKAPKMMSSSAVVDESDTASAKKRVRSKIANLKKTGKVQDAVSIFKEMYSQ